MLGYQPNIIHHNILNERFNKALSIVQFLPFVGFEMEKCSGKPEFYTILTLVFNFVQYEAVDLTTVLHIIKAVNKLYPKLRVIAAIPSSLKLDQSQFSDTKIIKYSTRWAAGFIRNIGMWVFTCWQACINGTSKWFIHRWQAHSVESSVKTGIAFYLKHKRIQKMTKKMKINRILCHRTLGEYIITVKL